jgi:hypothetical protein
VSTSTIHSGKVQDDVEGQEFRRLVARALQREKQEVFNQLKTDE